MPFALNPRGLLRRIVWGVRFASPPLSLASSKAVLRSNSRQFLAAVHSYPAQKFHGLAFVHFMLHRMYARIHDVAGHRIAASTATAVNASRMIAFANRSLHAISATIPSLYECDSQKKPWYCEPVE